MIHEFVFCFKGPAIPRATLPEASMVGLLRAADMLHGDVGHDLVHCRKYFIAGLPGFRLVLIDPLAGVLLLNGVPHEGVEGAGAMRPHVHTVVPHSVHVVQVLGRPKVVWPRGRHLIELVRPMVGEHLSVDMVVSGAGVRQTGEQNVTS